MTVGLSVGHGLHSTDEIVSPIIAVFPIRYPIILSVRNQNVGLTIMCVAVP